MIDLITRAIGQIAKPYYLSVNPSIRNGRPTGYRQPHVQPERSYVSQLVAKLQPLLPDEEGLQLDTDPYKWIYKKSYQHNTYLTSILELLGKPTGLYPDLIYHRGQLDTDPANQVFALECKIDSDLSQSAFNKDLIKLMIYKHELNFQTVVLLIANNSITKIKEFFEHYKSGYYCNPYRLHIIVIEEHGSLPYCIVHTQGNCA